MNNKITTNFHLVYILPLVISLCVTSSAAYAGYDSKYKDHRQNSSSKKKSTDHRKNKYSQRKVRDHRKKDYSKRKTVDHRKNSYSKSKKVDYRKSNASKIKKISYKNNNYAKRIKVKSRKNLLAQRKSEKKRNQSYTKNRKIPTSNRKTNSRRVLLSQRKNERRSQKIVLKRTVSNKDGKRYVKRNVARLEKPHSIYNANAVAPRNSTQQADNAKDRNRETEQRFSGFGKTTREMAEDLKPSPLTDMAELSSGNDGRRGTEQPDNGQAAENAIAQVGHVAGANYGKWGNQNSKPTNNSDHQFSSNNPFEQSQSDPSSNSNYNPAEDIKNDAENQQRGNFNLSSLANNVDDVQVSRAGSANVSSSLDTAGRTLAGIFGAAAASTPLGVVAAVAVVVDGVVDTYIQGQEEMEATRQKALDEISKQATADRIAAEEARAENKASKEATKEDKKDGKAAVGYRTADQGENILSASQQAQIKALQPKTTRAGNQIQVGRDGVEVIENNSSSIVNQLGPDGGLSQPGSANTDVNTVNGRVNAPVRNEPRHLEDNTVVTNGLRDDDDLLGIGTAPGNNTVNHPDNNNNDSEDSDDDDTSKVVKTASWWN